MRCSTEASSSSIVSFAVNSERIEAISTRKLMTTKNMPQIARGGADVYAGCSTAEDEILIEIVLISN
jgi:hypothetical protein